MIIILLILIIVILIYKYFAYVSYKKNNFINKKNISIVLSSFGDFEYIDEIIEIFGNDITIYLYDKSDKEFNNKYNNVIYKKLKNLGREQHTWLYHVINHYNKLTDKIIFSPLNFKKHLIRKNILKKIKQNNFNYSFICNEINQPLDLNFTMEQHDYETLDKSNYKNLGEFIQTFLKEKSIDNINICFNGIFMTTKQNILKNPKKLYKNIYNEVLSSNPLNIHYLERITRLLYA